jgi:hypothetical protein
MREAILNDVCCRVQFQTVDEGAIRVSEVVKGLAALIDGAVVERAIRLPAFATDITLGNEFTLYDVILQILKTPHLKDRGVLFASLIQLAPIDDGLSDESIEFLLLNTVVGFESSLSLLLCAFGNHVSLSLDQNGAWERDQLEVSVRHTNARGKTSETISTIDNLSKAAHADPIIVRHRAFLARATDKSTFWARKNECFPCLMFGLDVEAQIARLDTKIFDSVAERLIQLNGAAAIWAKSRRPSPEYSSKVTGESQTTMQKFGRLRDYRDATGKTTRYELHARVADGHRIYFRPLANSKKIEIGYVGPHLPTDLFPN